MLIPAWPQLPKTTEHLCYPVIITDPEWVVAFWAIDVPIQYYGFYQLTQRELNDGLIHRAAGLLHCSFLEPEMQNCGILIVGAARRLRAVYDLENMEYQLYADNETNP